MIIKVDKNHIFLYGRIWSGDEIYFEAYFSEIEKEQTEITVHIHTIGGDVFAGNYIKSRLKLSKATILMQVDGTAFSMGAFLLPAGSKRSMVSNGFIMIHEASGGTQGNANQHRKSADLLDDMNENFIEDLMSLTGKSRNYVMKWFEGDTYFNAKKALKEGLIDAIIDPVIDIKIDEKTAMKSEDAFNRFAALLIDDKKISNHLKLDDTMKKELIAMLGLVGVSAESSDTVVLDAVKAHIETKTSGIQGKYDSLKATHETLESQMKKEVKTKIDALLKPLDGKLDKTKIDQYRAIGEKSGVDALSLALEGVTPRKTVFDTITGKEGDEHVAEANKGWNWDKYQKEDPQALERLADSNPDAFNALYKAKFNKDYIKQ